MQITLMGLLIFPLGLLLFFMKPKLLPYVAVMLCGCTGMSILNLTGGGFGLQSSFYLCILWFIYRLIQKLISKDFNFKKVPLSLGLFFVFCMASLAMPFVLSSDIEILSVDNKYTGLSFSSSNITQFVYLVFVLVFVFFVSDAVYDKTLEVKKIIKYYLYGICLVMLITVYQIFAMRLSLPFDEIFRANLHGNVQGLRIYGPCLEASELCYYLVTGLPLLYRANIKKIFKFALIGLLILLGTYSYSSTFFVGLILWIVLEFILIILKYARKNTFNKKYFYIFMSAFFIIVLGIIVKKELVASLVTKVVYKFTDTVTVNNVSGSERTTALKTLLKAWSKSPVLGVGFGSSRGKDLFSTWLANTGILGFGAILIYLINAFRKNAGKYNYLKIPAFLVWICALISVPEPYNLFMWLFLAIVYNVTGEEE